MIVVGLAATERLPGPLHSSFTGAKMLQTNGIDARKKSRLTLCLLSLFGGMAVASAAGAQTPAAVTLEAGKRAEATPTYRVINLGAGDFINGLEINARGQVAFSLETGRDSPIRAWFYDGTAVREIITPGFASTSVNGMNDAGQVVGDSYNNSGNSRPFLWSARQGMALLSTPPGAYYSYASAINNRGDVVGSAGSTTPWNTGHAFRWPATGGTENLGTLAWNRPAGASAINDAGMIAGYSSAEMANTHAFVWTRATGMIDIDTLGNVESSALGVSAQGQVVGNYYGAGNHGTAFIWTRATGMRNLGTIGGADRSYASAMSASGQVVGVVYFGTWFLDWTWRAMTWTRERGMVDLGSLTDYSWANGVNNKGQVVGGAWTLDNDYHAFVWTAKHGIIDLNKRLRNAPAGLTLSSAHAISDNGSIVASSNAGLVLLTPGGAKATHAVGPIAGADLVQVGAAVEASVSFAAEDPTAKHNVLWSWGDGSGERAGNTRASKGAGSASGSHTYTAPGIYTVTANVVDLAGNSVTVSRKIVAYDPSGGSVGGSGSFMSPPATHSRGRPQAGMASFSFVAPSLASAKAQGAKAQLDFTVPGLSFRSENLQPVAAQGARGQFAGSGTINGRGDYKFTLDTTAGASGEGAPGRFGLKIWHIDPATRAEVVDYDNTSAQAGVAAGAAVMGKIAMQR